MELGPKLVIRGAIFASIIMAISVYQISSSWNLPSQSIAKAVSSNITGSNQDLISNGANVNSQSNSQMGCEVSDNYPDTILKWCNLIMKHSTKHAIPPDLIAALIWQESGGDPTAYSKSGAVGLMQVMPRDGLAANFMCVNGPCFAKRPTIDQLQDPEFNIKYGTRMLAGLIKRNGNVRDALKAYGPMNVGYYYADKVIGIQKRYGT